MKYLLPFCLLLVIMGCRADEDPQRIIDMVMKKSGTDELTHSMVNFKFRDKTYVMKRQQGNYQMIRFWQDTLGTVKDVLTNEDFKRMIDNEPINVSDSMATKYANAINSVFYFALLPFRLNDPAVVKHYLGSESIKDVSYHKVQITFLQEGGGQDFDDVFIYWINKDTLFIDYLAYSYHTDGGGMRFREAYNPRMINGVRIVDYINYKPPGDIELSEIGRSFESNQLRELSRIVLEEVAVTLY